MLRSRLGPANSVRQPAKASNHYRESVHPRFRSSVFVRASIVMLLACRSVSLVRTSGACILFFHYYYMLPFYTPAAQPGCFLRVGDGAH